MSSVAEIVNRCRSYDSEPEWFEFKQGTAVSKPDDIGEYISALSNAALMAGEPVGYLIWGVHNTTHELTGTKFNYQKDVDNEPFQHYLGRYVSPTIYFHFDEDLIEGNRVVVLTIPAARIVPTAYKDVRWIRIGSSKEKLSKYPDREAALFRVLNYGPSTMLNTESIYDDLTFDQLFLYYETNGIKLRKSTFKKNLGLLTSTGKYNLLAQLLSDNPHVPIRFAMFTGKDKTSIMYSVKEFGDTCILIALDKIIDYGDTLNIPQADERERKVIRPEVMLFDSAAFKEAVINAFQHNLWLSGAAPMFTAFEDRIEITSLGTLPPKQTKEGFYAGVSVPVNEKLTEIFIQLHISEKTGRGVPRIVGTYGEQAFKFSDNAITVTIPYNRIDLGTATQVTTQVATQVEAEEQPIDRRIIDYCVVARSTREIADMLGFKERKSAARYIRILVEQGRLAMTIPDKPRSQNQKYIAIK